MKNCTERSYKSLRDSTKYGIELDEGKMIKIIEPLLKYLEEDLQVRNKILHFKFY